LRISHTGRRKFIWFGRIRGRGMSVRMTLGPFPAVTLEKARELAREALHTALRGDDPRAPRRQKQEAARHTFEAVAKDFVERYVKRDRQLRTGREVERRIERHLLPGWGKRPIAEITRRDVRERLEQLVGEDDMRAGANRVFAVARKLFQWALSEDYVTVSPCVGLSAPVPERRGERVLADDEIRTVWKAADKIPNPMFGRFVRMLIATGQRRTEVGAMRWDDVDLTRREWTIGGARYKSGRAHVVPLNDAALAILRGCPRREASPWVFSTSGRAPISGFSAAKEQIDAIATDLPAWTFHDLRRSVASAMTALGIHRFDVERVLGHADRTLAAVYDRYDYLSQKREALDRWATRLRTIVKAKS
jgi:integrase